MSVRGSLARGEALTDLVSYISVSSALGGHSFHVGLHMSPWPIQFGGRILICSAFNFDMGASGEDK